MARRPAPACRVAGSAALRRPRRWSGLGPRPRQPLARAEGSARPKNRSRLDRADAFRTRRAATRRECLRSSVAAKPHFVRQRLAPQVLGGPLQRGRLDLLGCVRVPRGPREQVRDRRIAGHRNMPVPGRIHCRRKAGMRCGELQGVHRVHRLIADPMREADRLLWVVPLPGAEFLRSERMFVRPGEEGLRWRVRPAWPVRARRNCEPDDDEAAHDQLPVMARRPVVIRRSGSWAAMRPSVAIAASIRGAQTTPQLSRMQLSYPWLAEKMGPGPTAIPPSSARAGWVTEQT